VQAIDIIKSFFILCLLGTSLVSNAEHISKQIVSNNQFHCSLGSKGKVMCWGVGCTKDNNLDFLDIKLKGEVQEISLEKNRLCAITNTSQNAYVNCYLLTLRDNGKTCKYRTQGRTNIAGKNLKTKETLLKKENHEPILYKSVGNNFINLKSYTDKLGNSITCFIATSSKASRSGELWCRGKFRKSLKFSTTFPVLSDYYAFPGNNDYRSYPQERWYYSTDLVLDNVKDYIATTVDLCILTTQSEIKCLEKIKESGKFRFRSVDSSRYFSEFSIAKLNEYKYFDQNTINLKRKRYLQALDGNGFASNISKRYVLPNEIEKNQYSQLALSGEYGCGVRADKKNVDCWKRTARTKTRKIHFSFKRNVVQLSSSMNVFCARVRDDFEVDVICFNPSLERVKNNAVERRQLNGLEHTNKLVKVISNYTDICSRGVIGAAIADAVGAIDCSYVNIDKMKKVEVLNLNDLGIVDINKEDFEGLPLLVDIDLSENNIKKLPENIFSELSKIKSIDLGDNEITEVNKSIIGVSKTTIVSGVVIVIDICNRGKMGVLIAEALEATSCENVSIEAMNEADSLMLSSEKITKLPANAFIGFNSLEYIELDGNQIEVIHEDTFKNLEHLNFLDLGKNKIKSLSINTFKNLNSLETLYLDENKLTEINDGLFTNLKSLWELGLNNNEIVKVGKDSFKNTLVEGELYLDHNKIKYIKEGTFLTHSSLSHLDLAFNEIEEIHKDTFIGLKLLTEFNLEFNKIKKIAPGSFNNLKGLFHIDLTGNALRHISRSEVGLASRTRIIGVQEK